LKTFFKPILKETYITTTQDSPLVRLSDLQRSKVLQTLSTGKERQTRLKIPQKLKVFSNRSSVNDIKDSPNSTSSIFLASFSTNSKCQEGLL
jgi:hypothetical protein